MDKSYIEEIRLSRELANIIMKAKEVGYCFPKAVDNVLIRMQEIHRQQIENGIS